MNKSAEPVEQGQPEAARPIKKRRALRWILAGVVIIILLGVVLVLAAPTLLGTDFGRSRIAKAANNAIPGTVQIGSLHLSWFGGQSLGGCETVAVVERYSKSLRFDDAVQLHKQVN